MRWIGQHEMSRSEWSRKRSNKAAGRAEGAVEQEQHELQQARSAAEAVRLQQQQRWQRECKCKKCIAHSMC